MKRKLLVIEIILLMAFILSGCWDRVDVETRGFVLGVAIDKYPPNPQSSESIAPGETPPKQEEKLEDMETHTKGDAFAMTVQLPILKKSSAAASGAGGGGSTGANSAGSNTWEITQIGNSFFSMSREMQSRTSLSLFYEHLQVIVISDRVAREGIEDVIDFFVRDPEMRRRVKVFVSAGQAKSVLDVTPRIEDYSSLYLMQIPRNSAKNSRIVHKTDLGEVIQSNHAGFDYVLPRVVPTKDEIKASGGAIFKEGRMVGWATEIELEAMKFIRNIYMGGVITVEAPGHEGGLVDMEVTSAKTEVVPVIRNDELTFDISIKVNGNYAEEIKMHTHSKLTQSFLDELEKEYAKEIERMCKSTVTKMQEDYGADVFRFCHTVATKKPAYWKKIKDKWKTIYPTVGVNIKADVSIDLTGIVQ